MDINYEKKLKRQLARDASLLDNLFKDSPISPEIRKSSIYNIKFIYLIKYLSPQKLINNGNGLGNIITMLFRPMGLLYVCLEIAERKLMNFI